MRLKETDPNYNQDHKRAKPTIWGCIDSEGNNVDNENTAICLVVNNNDNNDEKKFGSNYTRMVIWYKANIVY